MLCEKWGMQCIHISNIFIQKKIRSLSLGTTRKSISSNSCTKVSTYFFPWESVSITIFATAEMCLFSIFWGIFPGTSLWEKKMTEPCSWAERERCYETEGSHKSAKLLDYLFKQRLGMGQNWVKLWIPMTFHLQLNLMSMFWKQIWYLWYDTLMSLFVPFQSTFKFKEKILLTFHFSLLLLSSLGLWRMDGYASTVRLSRLSLWHWQY